jgi:hypothetical protein
VSVEVVMVCMHSGWERIARHVPRFPPPLETFSPSTIRLALHFLSPSESRNKNAFGIVAKTLLSFLFDTGPRFSLNLC